MRKENRMIDGISVDYVLPDEPSAKPPIIFVHGGSHGSWCWEKFQTYFASLGHETLALNWYNHPGSKTLSNEEFCKRSILDVVTELDIVTRTLDRKAILFGHSMGGLASLHYSTIQSVAALILLAPVLPSVIGAPQIQVAPIDLDQAFPVPPFDQAYYMFFKGNTSEEAHEYYQKLVPESAQAVHEASYASADVDISKVLVPSFVIGAGEDILTPHDRVQLLAEKINATYVFLPDRSHNLLLEPNWEETADLIQLWMKDNMK
ncbi:alpha/beta hydrolase [Shimazuella kribbensis]|uniref:alpha/beta hydrolase n=1 Tax=Shimazuella kribbensis TaxID=139808 RepID=UPI0004061209|nr:alpha/beta hydrolase [Shimazuella kribbensis]